jgi:hypothetical protein
MADLGFPGEIVEALAGILLGEFVLHLRPRHAGVSSSAVGEIEDVQELSSLALWGWRWSWRWRGPWEVGGPRLADPTPSLDMVHGMARIRR